MRTFKPTIALRLLIVLFLLLPGIGLVVVGAIVQEGRTYCLASGLPCLLLAAWLWRLAGRPLLTVDENGAEKRGAFGGIVKLRFDEVSEYFYRATETHGTENVVFRLRAADGRQIKISSNFRDIYDAVQLLVDGVEARLQSPGFGPVKLESDAIVYKDKRVPLDEITSVTLVAGGLRVARKGKLLAAFTVGANQTPNVFLLLDQLRALGVNAPDARPWHAVVSLAGYQLPKR